MKDKIRALFKAVPDGPKIRVHTIKSVGGRWLVYASSPAFEGKTALERQKIIKALLTGAASPLTPHERKTIALVRTFTPAEMEGIKRTRPARKKKPGPAV